jgi:gas vesicle structural protein
MTNNELLDLDTEDLSLLETLDHALNRGLVIAGDITISVADIDLVFIGLNILVGSIETIEAVLKKREQKSSDG